MIFTCTNGELVDSNTGIVIEFSNFESFPSLSKDAQTLLRYFDGVSIEKLGTVSKFIVLSRAEEMLLRQISPWKFFKMAVRSDYLKMLDKMNQKKMSLNQSTKMKERWINPDSKYHKPEFTEKKRQAMKKLWEDPMSVFNTPEYKKTHQENTKRACTTRKSRANRSRAQKARYSSPRERRRTGMASKRNHAWKRLASMFEMLYVIKPYDKCLYHKKY